MFCNAVPFLYFVLLNLSAASTTWIQPQLLIYWSNLINGIFPKLCVKLTSKVFLSPISSPDLVCHLFTSFKCGKSVQPTVKKISRIFFSLMCADVCTSVVVHRFAKPGFHRLQFDSLISVCVFSSTLLTDLFLDITCWSHDRINTFTWAWGREAQIFLSISSQS